MSNEKSITQIIDTEYRSYSMYVLENRAIPSAIDGLKSVTRKLLYAMINDYSGKKTKVAELGGGLAKHGYHHGEASAMGAAIGLASDWSNNEPIFTGHGNFGSRIVQEAAAPRYIFASLSPAYKTWFVDLEVAPVSTSEENPEPAHYLPIIPWVLVNGISGIAVGFASNILPRSTDSIVKAVKQCLKDPAKYLAANVNIDPTFPSFRGTVINTEPNQWKTRGIIDYIGKYQFKISELPVGWDREGYVEFLNGLIDSGKIKDYEDGCSDAGFEFNVKVSGEQKDKIEQDPFKYFKLEKSHSENLTTIGYDGKLKIFESVAQLIHYFVEYRLTKFSDKIAYEIQQDTSEVEFAKNKIKFIEFVIDDKVDFRRTTKSQLIEFIKENVTEAEYGKLFASIPLYDCTSDAVEALQTKIAKLEGGLTVLRSTTPLARYLATLK